MAVIETSLKTDGENFKTKFEDMRQLIDDLNEKLDRAREEGPEKYTKKHKASGKLLARERVKALLDEGTEFLELMPLAGIDQDDMTLGGSIVGGIGMVSGRPCIINANVPTIKGGALNYVGVLKSQRLDTIARENQLPTIYLCESAGAHLPQQALVYNQGGVTFREISRRSKMGIPSVTIVFGSSTAGGAYIPGMSDYIIMVKKQAKVFLAGPPLVKMAINEESDEETLGGAEMHSRVSGVSDYLAKDEDEAIGKAREIMSHLNFPELKENSFNEPKYSPEEILGIISPDVSKPFNPREVIARLVDDSEFSEFKPEYGPTLVCGYARIHGYTVGILANQGILVSEAANKGAQFIQLCNQDNRPLLFLQNITGFMVGKKVEQEGIIKHGAKMINAVSNSEVPAITIMMGASYGAGNYAMCGRAYEPRFLFSWPNSKMAVMGPEQLAGVMEIIKRQAAEKAGVEVDEDQIAKIKKATIDQIETESSAYYATSRVWDDGIIDPRDTRRVLGTCLKTIHWNTEKKEGRASGGYGTFRM